MRPPREVIFKPPVGMFNSSRSWLKRCFKPARRPIGGAYSAGCELFRLLPNAVL